MLAGGMRHKDHVGNQGELVAGSVQWMTAGRGIIHSEMPIQKDGLMWGFQLWVNLPARDKMTAPRYQDIPPGKIPEVALGEGVRARVIAGEAGGVHGPVEGITTQPLYLDVTLAPGARLSHELPAGHKTAGPPASDDPADVRRELGDGCYGGDYERPDEDVLRVWAIGVEETREALVSLSAS